MGVNRELTLVGVVVAVPDVGDQPEAMQLNDVRRVWFPRHARRTRAAPEYQLFRKPS